MPTIGFNSNGEEFLYEIDALLAFPTEQKRWEELSLLNGIDAKLQRETDDWVRIKPDALQRLLAIESIAQVRTLAAEQKRRGRQSGHILMTIAMLDLAKQDASLNKAVYLIEALYKQFPAIFRDERAVSDRHLKDRWAHFRPVAHLWAACETLRLQQLGADAPIHVEFLRRTVEKQRPPGPTDEDWAVMIPEEQRKRVRVPPKDRCPDPVLWEPSEAALVVSYDALFDMLQLADWFLEFGVNHFSAHQHRDRKQPTLPRDEMWKWPGKWVWPIEVTASAFPQWAIAKLKTYSKRNLPDF
jgi:hypothetical protein